MPNYIKDAAQRIKDNVMGTEEQNRKAKEEMAKQDAKNPNTTQAKVNRMIDEYTTPAKPGRNIDRIYEKTKAAPQNTAPSKESSEYTTPATPGKNVQKIYENAQGYKNGGVVKKPVAKGYKNGGMVVLHKGKNC